MGAEVLRLGLAGCGRIAERGYLPAARGLPEVEFAAVADPDTERAAEFDDVGAMIAAREIDGLVVASPVEHHVEAAEIAARAGIPSLVEKPPAPDLAGAVRLAALDPAPSLAFNRRFLQGVELAPRVPAEGWLELDLELSFRRGGWGAHVSHDEALLDAGTHLIDLASFLTGSAPIAVRGASLSPERASLELELGRARARIHCATDARYAERVEVRDRAGALLAASRTGAFGARLSRLRGAPDPLVLSLRRQLKAFAARIGNADFVIKDAYAPQTTKSAGGGGVVLADAWDGVAVMAVVEAARRSAELGGAEVTIATPQAVEAE